MTRRETQLRADACTAEMCRGEIPTASQGYFGGGKEMRCKDMRLMTYLSCRAYLGDGIGTGRKIGPNTYARRVGDSYFIDFHGLTIVTLTADGATRLYSCGYRSRTTKDRLTRLTGVAICQRQFEWYVGCGMVPFREGINVGVAQTEREALETDVIAGVIPPGILLDYDMDHAS